MRGTTESRLNREKGKGKGKRLTGFYVYKRSTKLKINNTSGLLVFNCERVKMAKPRVLILGDETIQRGMKQVTIDLICWGCNLLIPFYQRKTKIFRHTDRILGCWGCSLLTPINQRKTKIFRHA